MLYLKLLDNKILKLNQSNDIYEGENKADKIVVYIDPKWQNYNCMLNIYIEEQMGDICEIQDGEQYILERKLLKKEQNLIVWIEMRKNDIVVKSSQIIIHVDSHYDIDNIIEDVNLSIFEGMLNNAIALNKETVEIKNQLPDLKDLEDKIKQLEEGLIKIKNFSVASQEDIETLFKKGGENE